jgi:hypothetical protein
MIIKEDRHMSIQAALRRNPVNLTLHWNGFIIQRPELLISVKVAIDPNLAADAAILALAPLINWELSTQKCGITRNSRCFSRRAIRRREEEGKKDA